MLVYIKPIDKEPWHGHKGKNDFSRDTVFTALVDSTSMRYAVEMNEQELEEYGKIMGRDLSLNFIPGKSHTFWDSKTAQVVLQNIPVVYDTSKPLDFIKYRICKASSVVANSEQEYRMGLYPKATHYIYSEEEEMAEKASKVSVKNNAIKLALKSTRIIKDAVCLIIGGRYTKELSSDAVDVIIDDLITENALKVKEAFEEANKDKTTLLVKNLVEEALYFNVLSKKPSGIYYFENSLGITKNDVVDFLLKDENQGLKIQIMKAIK